MIVDANVLLYAVDEEARGHGQAKAWLEGALNGHRRIGLPWPSIWAFVRISTHPRALRSPMTVADAWQQVDEWLAAPAAWIPQPGPGHRQLLGDLVVDLDLRGNLISDAVLAALAIEHGVPIVSADTDFARFPGLAWINPLSL